MRRPRMFKQIIVLGFCALLFSCSKKDNGNVSPQNGDNKPLDTLSTNASERQVMGTWYLAKECDTLIWFVGGHADPGNVGIFTSFTPAYYIKFTNNTYMLGATSTQNKAFYTSINLLQPSNKTTVADTQQNVAVTLLAEDVSNWDLTQQNGYWEYDSLSNSLADNTNVNNIINYPIMKIHPNISTTPNSLTIIYSIELNNFTAFTRTLYFTK